MAAVHCDLNVTGYARVNVLNRLSCCLVALLVRPSCWCRLIARGSEYTAVAFNTGAGSSRLQGMKGSARAISHFGNDSPLLWPQALILSVYSKTSSQALQVCVAPHPLTAWISMPFLSVTALSRLMSPAHMIDCLR